MGRSKIIPIVVASLLASVCTDTTAPEFVRTGRYTLARINGETLPAPVYENAYNTLEFYRGELRLETDATFTDVTDLRVTPKVSGGVITFKSDTARGTYRFAGDTVFLDSTRPEPIYYMVFQTSGSLTQILGPSTLVYRKAK